MEHIIQFGITIDDVAIKKKLEESALKQLSKDLTDDVKKIIFETNRYSGKITDEVTEWTELRFNEFLAQHKDEIVNRAAALLADKLSRTKAAKAALEGVLNANS